VARVQAKLIARSRTRARRRASSYYARWLLAFERLLADKGLLDADALAERTTTSRPAAATTCSSLPQYPAKESAMALDPRPGQ